jgi:hypothetical protein
MEFETWQAFYKSDFQAVYALGVLPGLFLSYWLLTAPRRLASDTPTELFVRLYALLFCIETLIDPIATGPLVSALQLGETGATAMGLTFVLLGDFRVFVLVLTVASPDRSRAASIGEALLWTPVVAVSGFAVHAALDSILGGVPGQLLWMIHELLFIAICVALRGVVNRRMPADAAHRKKLMRAIGFVMLYYGLWAGADALILFGDFDWGWAVRVIPNQLYYAVWVPFVYALFFHASPSRR